MKTKNISYFTHVKSLIILYVIILFDFVGICQIVINIDLVHKPELTNLSGHKITYYCLLNCANVLANSDLLSRYSATLAMKLYFWPPGNSILTLV